MQSMCKRMEKGREEAPHTNGKKIQEREKPQRNKSEKF